MYILQKLLNITWGEFCFLLKLLNELRDVICIPQNCEINYGHKIVHKLYITNLLTNTDAAEQPKKGTYPGRYLYKDILCISSGRARKKSRGLIPDI